ncbi:BSD domain-containing protein 1 isoform X2 [Ictalurus punctatus]|uniref:BSD domain-containing protein 1 isoform X2 n=1 Tax=Ictalurus punctatus TaxID=7998 RepID=A0A2D0QMD5_ICTPU|nr:BSD domain-containing protein 1 isoform X2 [Ictalurus punctatus]
MAEGEGGWWGGWLQQSFQSIKDRSSEAYEFIKRDLTEFSNVVQHDTACSIVATANAVKTKLAVEGSSETTEKVKKSLSNILGVITDTLAPPPDMTIDCDVITLVATPAGTTEVYDSTKARLYSLQADPATYCNEPDGPPEQFDAWLSSFSLEEKKAEISELLVNSPSIRALYTKMVPAAVAHSEFWQRYFYRVFQLDQEEAKRVALKRRAEETAQSESLGWEEEEEDEFLGASSPSRLDFTPPPPPPVTVETGPSRASSSEVAGPHGDTASDITPSVSSDSVSLPTQLEILPQSHAIAPAEDEKQKSAAAAEGAREEGARVRAEGAREEGARVRAEGAREEGARVRAEGAREEGARVRAEGAREQEARKLEVVQDLRVFELNSDSGKSTPSTNGKKGSSTDVSEDWEKDFDLDMTEEEVQLALSKTDAAAEFDDEDWENWE